MNRNTNHSFLGSFFCAMAPAAVVLALALSAHAQSASQQSTPSARRQKAASKTHKVWTEDDISTVRTPADRYLEAKETQTADAASQQTAAPAQPATAAKSDKPAGKPPLAVAKSVDDADAKIAWEQKDIQGQQETIERLQQRLATAAPEEREHLQKLIEQHKQTLADTEKEMQGLEQQKKELQKKPPQQ